MSSRSSLRVLMALLAALGLWAFSAASVSVAAGDVPVPALEDGEFIDEAELAEDPFEFDEEVAIDDEAPTEDEFCEAGTRQAGEEDTEDLLEPGDEDEFGVDDVGDEFADGVCETVVDEAAPTATVHAVQHKRLLVVSAIMPSTGRLTSTLTSGARILGRARQKVARAGLTTIRIKLTKQGRRVLRKATHELSLTLSTRLHLAKGKTVKRSKPLTVQPQDTGP